MEDGSPSATEFWGEATIYVPHGVGKKLIRGMRVIVRTMTKMTLDEEKGDEEDLIFEHAIVLPIGPVTLDEGMNLSVVSPRCIRSKM